MFLSQYPPGKRQFALDLFGKWKPNANYTESDGLLLLGKGTVFLFLSELALPIVLHRIR